jgi:hypothetical protein
MSVYKEIGKLAQKIESRSNRIYSDACDYGVKVTRYDSLLREIKSVCKDQYDLKSETSKYPTGATQTFKFDGGVPAVIEAGFEKANFVFVYTPSEKDFGYVYVTTETSLETKLKVNNYDQ